MAETAPFAPIELLDPQPPAAGVEHGLHRERVLGLLLVLVIAVFSLWQVATATRRFNAYQRGIQADAVQDWATALAAYQEAGDYSDVARRAARARLLVAEVHALEEQVAVAESSCHTSGLDAALNRLQQIAPHSPVTVRLSRDLASAQTWLLWCRSQSEPAGSSVPYLRLLNYPRFCAAGDQVACKPQIRIVKMSGEG
jgi:hypothetical protein